MNQWFARATAIRYFWASQVLQICVYLGRLQSFLSLKQSPWHLQRTVLSIRSETRNFSLGRLPGPVPLTETGQAYLPQLTKRYLWLHFMLGETTPDNTQGQQAATFVWFLSMLWCCLVFPPEVGPPGHSRWCCRALMLCSWCCAGSSSEPKQNITSCWTGAVCWDLQTCAFPHNFRFQVIAFFAGAVSFGHIVKASEPVVSSFLNFAFLGEAGVTQGKAIKRAFLCVRVDHALQNRYRSVFIPCKRPHSPADKKEQSFIQWIPSSKALYIYIFIHTPPLSPWIVLFKCVILPCRIFLAWFCCPDSLSVVYMFLLATDAGDAMASLCISLAHHWRCWFGKRIWALF